MSKTGRKTLLTPEREAQILASIRAGAFDWVAARAAGVSVPTFYRWLADKRKPYRDFAEKVAEARAVARLSVEIEVRKKSPEFWLSRGPGRERPGEPGWSEKTILEHTGPGGGPVKTETQARIVHDDSRVAQILGVLSEHGFLPKPPEDSDT